MRTSVTKVKATTSSSGIIGKKDVYYIGFQPFMEIPTVITRKKITPLINNRRIGIKNIRKISPVRGKCIQVEGGVYLAGRKLIPTHNSFIVALACIIISCIQKEVVAVVAPTNDKALIIMRYYIQHLGDNPMFYQQLEKNTRLERLRMEESKERIMLKNGGGIYMISVQAGNSKKGVESAMGSGARVLISDESSLVPDQIEATIFRMIAGKGPEAFYCKIGNPFYRNHFFRSSNNPQYKQIHIAYEQGIAEKRYTPEFIEEARLKPYFDVLFACKFPEAEGIDQGGYSLLVTEKELQARLRPTTNLFGTLYLGCDVAGEGSNKSVIVLRGRNGAKVLYKENQRDTMAFAATIANFALIHKPKKIYVDATGIGKPVYDRLREFPELTGVFAVIAGSKPEDEVNFMNKRAEMFWRLKDWLPTSELEGEDWKDILDVRYKIQSDKKIKLKSKQEMLKDGVQSPDVADALALTFHDRETMFGKPQDTETKFFREAMKKKKALQGGTRKHLFIK